MAHGAASFIDNIWLNLAEPNINNFLIHTDIIEHFPRVSEFPKHSGSEQSPKHVFLKMFMAENIRYFVDDLSQVNWEVMS